jgi:hypothetical protein
MLENFFSNIEYTYCRKINIKYNFNRCCGVCNKELKKETHILNTWGDKILNVYGYMCYNCEKNRLNIMNKLISEINMNKLNEINIKLLEEDNIIWKNALENFNNIVNNDTEFDFVLYNINEELDLFKELKYYNDEIKYLK